MSARKVTHSSALRTTRTLTADVNAAYALMGRALGRLDDTAAGYPSGDNGDGDGTSRTERLGCAPPDVARVDQARLLALVARVAADAFAMRSLVTHWGTITKHEGRDVDERWCASCSRFGHHTPPANGRKRCRWCDDYRRANDDSDPPRALVERHLAGHYITKADIERALTRTTTVRNSS